MLDARPMDAIDDLLRRVDAGELGDPLPVLAYVAGRDVRLDEDELNGARRRAVLLRTGSSCERRRPRQKRPTPRSPAEISQIPVAKGTST